MRPNPRPIAHFEDTVRALPILDVGSCEPLKAAFHGAALTLAALMGAYNSAAWLRRRQPHLAINAAIYIAAVFWEQRHVAHHLVRCFPPREAVQALAAEPAATAAPLAEDRQAA